MNQSSFLQSPEWEGFQKNLGRSAWRIENVLIVRYLTGTGRLNYLYAGRPALPEKIESFLAEIRKIAKSEQSVFLRIDRTELMDNPAVRAHGALPEHGDKTPVGNIHTRDVLAGYYGRPGRSMQPQRTAALDLLKPESGLLSAMHEKTRYNVRLAEKKGVVVKKVLRRAAKEDFEIFWNLLEVTSRRNKFCTHSRKHYELLMETHSPHFSNEFFFAEYQGKPIAAAMVNFYRPTFGIPGVATYLHGASSDEARSVMAPYALHWHIAIEAKQRGFGWYDLWGIDEKKWPGVTRFKRGFGADEIAYAPPVEIVYRPFLAGLYRAVKWFR